MGTPTVVHLVRHGEVHNPDGILYGRMPGFGLSDGGSKMARRLSEHFAGCDVTHLVCSPLQRARETATPLAEAMSLSIATDDRLVEAANTFEGQRWGGRGGILSRRSNWGHLRNPMKPSWGEPYVDIVLRMSMAVEAARLNAFGHEAVCVSHQLPIWILRSAAEGKRLWHDPRRRECALASVTSLHFEDERLTGVDYVEPCGASGAGVGA